MSITRVCIKKKLFESLYKEMWERWLPNRNISWNDIIAGGEAQFVCLFYNFCLFIHSFFTEFDLLRWPSFQHKEKSHK